MAFDMQPDWLYLDGPAIKDVFGVERMKDFMPLRNMIDAGWRCRRFRPHDPF